MVPIESLGRTNNSLATSPSTYDFTNQRQIADPVVTTFSSGAAIISFPLGNYQSHLESERRYSNEKSRKVGTAISIAYSHDPARECQCSIVIPPWPLCLCGVAARARAP